MVWNTVFKNWNAKNAHYNHLLNVIGREPDSELGRKLAAIFDEIRRLNREWDEVVGEYRKTTWENDLLPSGG